MASITINGVVFDKYHPRAAAPVLWVQGEELSDVYKKPSDAKIRAFNWCKDECEKLNGFNFAIVGHSSQIFSVGFDFEHPETGERMMAHYTGFHKHLYHW